MLTPPRSCESTEVRACARYVMQQANSSGFAVISDRNQLYEHTAAKRRFAMTDLAYHAYLQAGGEYATILEKNAASYLHKLETLVARLRASTPI